MGLDNLYRRRRRRRQLRRMLGIIALMMLVAVMLVAVRACSDKVNTDMQEVYRPLDDQAQKYLEKKLKEKFRDQMNQLGR